MSAARLREAAALMRERAEAATEGAWSSEFISVDAVPEAHIVDRWFVMGHFANGSPTGPVSTSEYRPDAEHIASWHPAVALAVADLLDDQAKIIEVTGQPGFDVDGMGDANCLNLANAYLGGAA